MTESKELEYSRLAGEVAEIEKLIRSGSRSDIGYLLAPFLDNARSRMAQIRMDESQSEDDKKDRKQKEISAVAAMVERESQLNAEEKEQYGRFLAMDYFRKKDLDELAAFYKDGGGYDKLSEEGKAQMSHRIEEGIRCGEFTRDDLPEQVDRKNDEFRGASGNSRQELPPVKSASPEADSSRKTNSGEKNASEVEKVREESTDQPLAFVDSPTPVNPTEIRCPPGNGRAI